MLPTGWTDEKDISSSASWNFTKGMAVFEGGNKQESSASFITEAIDLSESIMPVFSFNYSSQHYSGVVDSLVVYWRSENNTEWESIFVNTKIQSKLINVDFELTEEQQTEGFQLKFEGWTKYGGNIIIDDIKIINTTSCTTPPTDLNIISISATSVSFMWKAVSFADSSRIIITTEPFVDINEVDSKTFVTDVMSKNLSSLSSYSVSNLEPGTNYYAYVQSSCGSGDVSEFCMLRFNTPCEPIEVGSSYLEGFESGRACWDLDNYITVSSEQSYEGLNSLCFSTNEDEYSYAIAPFDATLNSMEFSFYVYAPKVKSAELYVAVVDNPENLSYLEPVQIIKPTKEEEWQKVIVTFLDYSGSGKYIVLYGGAAEKENLIYVDNVNMQQTSTSYSPQLLYADDVRSYSANVNWTEIGSATSWNLRVSNSVLDLDILKASSVSDLLVSNSTTYKLDNLTPNTKYYVYIQSVGADWASEPIEINTSNVINIDYYDEFVQSVISDLIPNWYYGNLQDLYVNNNWAEWQYHELYPYPVIYSKNNSDNGSEGASLRFHSHEDSSSIPFVIFPEFDKDLDLKDIQVSFWLNLENKQYPFSVSVCEGYDISTAVILDTIYLAADNTWEEFVVSFENYTGDGRNIAFSPLLGNHITVSSDFYLDDLTIENINQCNTPGSLDVYDIEPHKATIKCTTVGASAGSTWSIELYRDSKYDNDRIEADTTFTATSIPYTMSGLESGIRYYAYVKLIGSDCTSKWSSEFYFRTEEEIVLPYFNDFAKEPTGSVNRGPEGWILYNPRGTDNNDDFIPYVHDGSWNITSGNRPYDLNDNYLYFAGRSADTPIGVMPIMSDQYDMSALKISFYAGCYAKSTTSHQHNLIVGVMSDPNDMSTFTAVDSIFILNFEAIQECFVDLANYSGIGRYIAFKGWSDNSIDIIDNNFYIDNLRIYEKTDCERVTAVDIVPKNASTLDISWTKGLNEKSWSIKVFDTAITAVDIDNITPIKETTSSKEKVTISGFKLLNNTTYYIAIQSIGNDCESEWRITEFTTDCSYEYLSLPYIEKFDDYGIGKLTSPTCWYLKPSGAYYEAELTRGMWYPDYEYGTVSGGVLWLEAQYLGSTDAGYSYAIMPKIDSLKYTTLDFYFYAYNTNSYVEIGVMEGIDETFTDQSITYSSMPANDELFTPMFRYKVEGNTRQYKRVSYNFSSYEGKGDRIAFRIGKHTNISSSATALIDHLTLSRTTDCTVIDDAEVTSVISNSITYDWSALYENQWQIKLSTTEIDPATDDADVVNAEIINTNSYKAESLAQDTKYYFYVRRINTEKGCEGEWSEAVVATTACSSVSIGYSDDFETNDNNSDIHCFTFFGNSETMPYLTRHSLNITGQESTTVDSYCLAMENTTKTMAGNTLIKNVYAILPEIDIDNMDDIELTFRVYNPEANGGQIEVALVTDASSYDNMNATYVSVYRDTIPQGVWSDIRVKFTGVEEDDFGDKGKHIAISAMGGWTGNEMTSNLIYIDDVIISENIKGCEKPLRLKVDSIGESAVELSWLADNISGYEVKITADGVDNIDTIVQTNPAIIENLQVNKIQRASVRSICLNGEYSDWSDEVEFYTYGCDNDKLPYFEGFENYNNYEDRLSNCISWYQYDTLATSDPYVLSANANMSGTCMTFPSGMLGVLPMTNNVSNLVMQLDVLLTIGNSPEYNMCVEAGVARWINDSLTFISFEKLIPETTSKSFTYRVDYSNYAAQIQIGDQIAIYSVAKYTYGSSISYYYDTYIDNILVDSKDAIWIPENPAILDPSYDAVSFTCDHMITPDVMEIVAMKDDQTENNATIFAFTEAPFDSVRVTGLDSKTAYRIAVRIKKDGKYSAWSTPLSFTTLQIPANLPYYCDFEDADQNLEWDFVAHSNPATIPSDVNWTINTATAFDGNKSMYCSTNGVDYAYKAGSWYSRAMRSVEITEVGDYEFSANVKCPLNSTSCYMSMSLVPAEYSVDGMFCYYLDNPITKETYNIQSNYIDKVSNGFPYNEWNSSNNIVKVTKPGIYNIVIYSYIWINGDLADGTYPAAIDNIKLAKKSVLPPSDIVVSDISYHTASASWSVENGVDNCTVLITNEANSDSLTYNVSGTVNKLPITGLDYSTRYTMYIVAHKGNEQSVESITRFISLPQPISELPYICSFDDATENNRWLFEEAGDANSWFIGDGTSYDGVNSLYIRNLTNAAYSYGFGETRNWVYREVEFTEPSVYKVSMMAKCRTNDPKDFVNVLLIPSSCVINFSTGEYTDTLTGQMFDMDNTLYTTNNNLVVNKYNEYMDWTEVYREILVEKAGIYKLAIYFETDNSTYNGNPGAIDSIAISESTCTEPINFIVSSVNDTAATFSWISGSGVTSWDMIIADSCVSDIITLNDDNRLVTETSMDASSYTVSTLSPATTYYVYVKSNCQEQDYVINQFTTSDNILSIPYYQTFDIDMSHIDTYWSVPGNNALLSTYIKDPAISDLDTTLQMNDGALVVLPAFKSNVNELELSFDVISSSTNNSKVYIGVVSDPNDAATFTALKTFEVPAYISATNAISERVYYSLENYVGGGNIAIKSSQQLYIDDLLVESVGSQCITPSSLDISNITSNEAVISWNAMTNKTRVVIAKSEAYDISSLKASSIVCDTIFENGVSSNQFDLNPATCYYVYAASICDSGEQSTSISNKFWTSPGIIDIPYYETFENFKAMEDLTNLGWTTVSGYCYYYTTYAVAELMMGSNACLVFPEFDSNYEINDLMLDLRIMSSDQICVGVLETPGDVNSFDTIATYVLYSPENTVDGTLYTINLSQYKGESRELALKTRAYGTCYVCDVRLYEIPECLAPSNLQIDDIKDKSAVLSFTVENPKQSEWDIIVLDRAATNDELNAMTETDVAYMSSIQSNTDIELMGLVGATEYYVYVRSKCSDIAEWSDYVTFTTLMSPLLLPYIETFSTTESNYLPIGWYRSGSDIETGGVLDYMLPSYYLYKDFAVVNIDSILSSPLLSISMDADTIDSVHEWAISPEIDLDEKSMLAFDLSIEKGDNYSIIEDSIMSNRESEIRMLISDDNAETWVEALVIGDNESADYQLYDFFENTIRITYDMSEYLGDTIRFAFYVDNEDMVYLDAHIDNIAINCMGDREYDAVISQGYDYTENGFDIFYANLEAGTTTTYETYVPSSELGVCDSTFTVNLTVLETVVTNLTAEVCSGGSVYDENGFTEYYPGLYLNRGVAVSGADSLTYLTLVAREPNEITPITDYICEGSEYEFAGVIRTEAGIYYDTLADVNGCDSIIELTLSVVAGGETKYEIDTICAGDYYELGDTLYGETGVYTRELQTENGCAYTVELKLTVLDVDTTYVDKTITLDELPYTHRDMTFDENTVVGEYTHEFSIDNGTDCPDVEIYTLKVIEGEVTVDDTRILDLSMYPNPLTSGATLYVDAEFTVVERDGMVIEVMNTVGQLIVRETPATEEITINGLTESGVYIVRITTGTGVQYLGKVIVK